MTSQPLTPRPLEIHERKIKEKYAESFANQSDLMDQLAQHLQPSFGPGPAFALMYRPSTTQAG